MRDNKRFLEELHKTTGRPHEQIVKDFQRDFYLSAEESVEYGMVDQVIRRGGPVKGRAECSSGSPVGRGRITGPLTRPLAT
jgi:hypothetical protein